MTEPVNDRDQLASDALDDALTGAHPSTSEDVGARLDQLRRVREQLADDSDAPPPETLEAMVSTAMRLGRDPHHAGTLGAEQVPTELVTARRPHRSARARGRWVAAAAAVLIVTAGLAVLRMQPTTDESAGDSATLSSSEGPQPESSAGVEQEDRSETVSPDATPEDLTAEADVTTGQPPTAGGSDDGPDEGGASVFAGLRASATAPLS